MGAQKIRWKSSCNLFLYTIHLKAKLNKVSKYLKTKFFSRETNILPQMHGTSNILEHSATTIGGFWVSLNYSVLNLCPKKVWMGHWQLHGIFTIYVYCLRKIVRWKPFVFSHFTMAAIPHIKCGVGSGQKNGTFHGSQTHIWVIQYYI